VLNVPQLDTLIAELTAGSAAETDGTAALSHGRRRRLGAFFTPRPLVRFVVDVTLSSLARCGRTGRRPWTVLDPSAGDGRFLAATAEWAAARGQPPPRLIGIERDPRFAELARAALGARAEIHCAEALLGAPGLPAIDAVVGNPPYRRSIHLERSDPELWRQLRGRYLATSYREWDLYAAFIEQSLAWVGEGGHVGLVVPSRWLTAAFAERLRASLGHARAVRAIVDFAAHQLFAGATTYTSIAVLSQRPVRSVAVGRWSEQGWQCGQLRTRLTGAPWRLATGTARRRLQSLAAAGPALADVAYIVKGTGTNADPVFVLEDGYSRALGEPVDIEPELLRPCLRGRDIRGYGAVDPRVQLVYPYDPSGALLAPSQLPARAAQYLARCRELLEARERGRFRGDRFYQFGRPQNLTFLADPAPKIVVPDVAREARALLDTSGALVLDSAYAIRPRPGSGVCPAALLDLFNSPLVGLWLRETGVRLRGDYVRLKTAYLASLPVVDVNQVQSLLAWRADTADVEVER
jgi:hypothetical protein